jgi:hypothetical protein
VSLAVHPGKGSPITCPNAFTGTAFSFKERDNGFYDAGGAGTISADARAAMRKKPPGIRGGTATQPT